jgi:hypothetical protein
MTDFASQLKEWELFFSTVSLAAATLAGLLFVSLSLRPEKLKDPTEAQYLTLARGSFGDFLYLLMLGLVFLVPHQSPFGLAVALLVLGGARAVGLFRTSARRELRASEVRAVAHTLRQVALPALASVGLMAVGIAVWLGETLAIYALVLVIAALLTTASWNAWLILLGRSP